MSLKSFQSLLKIAIVLIAMLLVVVNGRPSEFSDNSQLVSDQDGSLPEGNLKQLEQFLAQRIADMENQAAESEVIERALRLKRQHRYRQCYFNPISCFKK